MPESEKVKLLQVGRTHQLHFSLHLRSYAGMRWLLRSLKFQLAEATIYRCYQFNLLHEDTIGQIIDGAIGEKPHRGLRSHWLDECVSPL